MSDVSLKLRSLLSVKKPLFIVDGRPVKPMSDEEIEIMMVMFNMTRLEAKTAQSLQYRRLRDGVRL